VEKIDFVGKMRRGPCGCNRFRKKAVEISFFREALGLPLIKTGSLDDGKVRILPFIGTVHGYFIFLVAAVPPPPHSYRFI
jgi:hypothetical protein